MTMRKDIAGQKVGAQMISVADGSPFTGAVSVLITGDAGTQAAGTVGSGLCTHEGNGYHTYAPSQAETNYDLIAFTFVGSGAIAVTVQVFTDERLRQIQNKTDLIISSNVTVSSPVSRVGNKIVIERGATLIIPIVGLGSLVGVDKIYFTVKDSLADADQQARIQVDDADGLIRLNGAVGTSGDGSIVVDDSALGSITVRIDAASSSQLETTLSRQSRGLTDAACYYDLRTITGGVVDTPAHGRFVVEGEVTRAIS